MKQIISIIFISTCLLMLVIPFAKIERRKGVTSSIDNRELIEFPIWGIDGYTAGVEAYLQDRIGLRSQMINAYNVFNDNVFNELTHPSYTYGQDGYVFSKMHVNRSYGDYARTFAEMVKKTQEYCETRNTKFYFLFDPEKNSVYRRYLPKGVNYDDSWVDEMCSYMDELGVNYVNNKQLLIEKSQNEQVFNRVYDAGHWNDLGCFYATNALYERISEDIPEITPMDKGEFLISETEAIALPVSEFKISEMVPKFELKADIEDITKEWESEVERNKSFRAFIYQINLENDADDFPKLLMFQGSYYNRGPQFIAGRAKEYIGIHNYQNILDLPYYYNIFKPDIVVLDAAEYVFGDSYFDLQKMKNMDLNPSLLNESESIGQEIEKMKADLDEVHCDVCVDFLCGEKVDRTFLGHPFADAKYAYLVVDNEVYDFLRDDSGNWILSLGHGKLKEGGNGLIVIKEDNGACIWIDTFFRKIDILTKELTYSEHASIDTNDDGSVITLKTDVKNNKFSSVNLQIINSETGEYIKTIDGISTKGMLIGTYCHDLPTGRYKFILKGNTNLRDESVSFEADLIEGEKYTYSFNVDELTKKEVKLSELEMYGRVAKKDILAKDFECSEGASISEDKSSFVLKTDLHDNKFNAINLQVFNGETGEYIKSFASTSTMGELKGVYVHDLPSGKYKFYLRGNANLRDEYVAFEADLVESQRYQYSFRLDELTEKEVEIREFTMYGYVDN